MLRELKEELAAMFLVCEPFALQGGLSALSLFAIIIANYDSIQLLWETAVHATSDTKLKARIHGVGSQMQSFQFLFGLVLSEVILRHTDKLSQTLQQPKLSRIEGHGVAMLTVKTLEGLQTEDNFDLFWERLEKTSWMWTSQSQRGDKRCASD